NRFPHGDAVSLVVERRRCIWSERQGSGRLLVVVVLDLFEVGVDHVVVFGGIARSGGFRFFLAGLVHGFPELHRGLGQRGGLFLDRFGVIALERGFRVGDRGFDLGLHFGG